MGGANNRNPLPIIIPCHRVVGSRGELTGYAPGLAYKIRLLQLEQITIEPAQTPRSAPAPSEPRCNRPGLDLGRDTG